MGVEEGAGVLLLILGQMLDERFPIAVNGGVLAAVQGDKTPDEVGGHIVVPVLVLIQPSGQVLPTEIGGIQSQGGQGQDDPLDGGGDGLAAELAALDGGHHSGHIGLDVRIFGLPTLCAVQGTQATQHDPFRTKLASSFLVRRLVAVDAGSDGVGGLLGQVGGGSLVCYGDNADGGNQVSACFFCGDYIGACFIKGEGSVALVIGNNIQLLELSISVNF